MKNIKRFFSLFAGIAIAACLTPSCKKGDVGPQGPQGTQGAAGEAGAQGTAGLAGNTLLNGEGSPSADLGKNGDFYLDLTSMSLYGPKTTSGWGSAIPVSGAQGEAGAAGAAGADGNANVITDTFTVANEDWGGRGDFSHLVQYSPGTGTSFPGMYFTRYNYSINQSVLDSGVVMVSYRSAPDFEGDDNRWTPMPMSFYGGTFTDNLDFTTNKYSVRLEFYLTPSFSHTGWAIQEDMSGVLLPTYNVKVVVISSSSVVREIEGIMKARKAGSVSAN